MLFAEDVSVAFVKTTTIAEAKARFGRAPDVAAIVVLDAEGNALSDDDKVPEDAVLTAVVQFAGRWGLGWVVWAPSPIGFLD